jgi:hypothetical protein
VAWANQLCLGGVFSSSLRPTGALGTNKLLQLSWIVVATFLVGCGGGGGANAPTTGAQQAPLALGQDGGATNALPVLVDQGPAEVAASGRSSVNALFATVTVCTPGSSTQCETIDHVLVDTGSVGLRLIASALDGTVLPSPVADAASGTPLRECVQFAGGYAWGSVVAADVQLAGRTLKSLPLTLAGDPDAGVAPPGCAWGTAQTTVAVLRAKGVLGVGHFLHDCGFVCAMQSVPGMYYTCPKAGSGELCRPATVPLERQVRNPVAALDSDNNGVTLTLASVPQYGASAVGGTLFFGVGTRANNALGSAKVFALDNDGTFVTNYAGQSQQGFLDSGSNGYFFVANSLAGCIRNVGFYCPVAGGQSTSVPQTAAIVGRNGTTATVGFTVDNIDQIFTGQAALPGLAGPSSGLLGVGGVFDWGLPFFYGRTVHLLFEGQSLAGVTGPAVAFD